MQAYDEDRCTRLGLSFSENQITSTPAAPPGHPRAAHGHYPALPTPRPQPPSRSLLATPGPPSKATAPDLVGLGPQPQPTP